MNHTPQSAFEYYEFPALAMPLCQNLWVMARVSEAANLIQSLPEFPRMMYGLVNQIT